jgi:hypothetical protein
MPTIDRIGPYRFFFYSNESDEPPHVHVERDRGDLTAKFWIGPVRLARSSFTPADTRAVRRMIESRQAEYRRAWHEHFGR